MDNGCGRGAKQESLDDIDKMKGGTAENKKASAEVNWLCRIIVSRMLYSYVDPTATLLPTRDTVYLGNPLEANIQLKVNITPRLFAYTDISLIYQNGWLFYQYDSKWRTQAVPDHDVATIRPRWCQRILCLVHAQALPELSHRTQAHHLGLDLPSTRPT